MKFDLKLVVGGQPLSVARDLLRRNETFTPARAEQFLRLTDAETASYISALIEAGYVKCETEDRGPDRPARFAPTQLGISLRKVRKTKRISRSAADRAVDALLTAIEQVNGTPDLITSVEEADLFGSYVQGADDLGDVDVAVVLKRRLPDEEWVKASHERAAATGRRMSFIDGLIWGEVEVWRVLRAASRHLDVQEKADIIQLGCPLAPLFRVSAV
jgi:hypothetical protein